MTDLEYKILNYLHTKANHPDSEVDIHKFSIEQYDNLNQISIKVHQEELGLTENEFEEIITQIYNILRLRITEQEWNIVITHYLWQLSSDIFQLHKKINLVECLDKLYYLATWMDKRTTYKFTRDIPYIQDILYKKFEIQETIQEKANRKVKIYNLSHLGR